MSLVALWLAGVPPLGAKAQEQQPDGEATAGISLEIDKQSNDIDEMVARAFEDEQKHNLKAAIADWSEVLKRDPDNIDYLAARGELLGEDRQLEAGLQDAAKILELDPKNISARILRSKTYEIQGKFDQALLELNASIERNPNSVEPYMARRDFYTRQDRNDEALADSDRILQLSPDPTDGYLSRANIYVETEEFDKAIEYASKALQSDPENWLGFYLRGGAHAKKFEFAEAMKDLDEAERLAPNRSEVWGSRGAAHAENGEFEKALEALQRGIELQPGDYVLTGGMAEILATCPDPKLRNGRKAAELMDETLRRSLNQRSLWEVCAAVAAENGDFEEAIRWEKKYMAHDSIAPADKAQAQMKLERYEKHKPWRFPPKAVLDRVTSNASAKARTPVEFQQAAHDLELMSEVTPDDPIVWNDLAWLRATSPEESVRDGQKAVEAAERAYSLDPKVPSIWDTRAAAFAEKGDFENAVKWEQKFLEATDLQPAQCDQGSARLSLYQSRKPYREHPTKDPSPIPSRSSAPQEK